MKKSEKNQIAIGIADRCKNLTEISAEYGKVKEMYGADVAKDVINFAKQFKRAELERVDDKRKELIDGITGERVLTAVFKDVKRDSRYRWLATRAESKVNGDVMQLVARWYPDTIDGMPARRAYTDDTKTTRVWELKPITRTNAVSILVACIKNLAKGAKHQKMGTVKHELGEIIPNE